MVVAIYCAKFIPKIQSFIFYTSEKHCTELTVKKEKSIIVKNISLFMVLSSSILVFTALFNSLNRRNFNFAVFVFYGVDLVCCVGKSL